MMKNIILFLILLCATISYGQGVNLKDRDSLAYNSLTTSDLFGVQRPSGGVYSWYKTSWYGLSFGVRSVMLGQTNIWTATNTFNDPVYLNDITYNYIMTPLSSAFFSTLGQSDKPYKYIYGNHIIVVNPLDTTQTGEITYSDGNISIGDSSVTTLGSVAKPFKSIYTDSVKSNTRLHLSAPKGVEVTGIFQYNPQLNVAVTSDDSSLIVTSNFIELAPAGAIQIDTLYIDPNLLGYTPGIEITIYNKSTNPITFGDNNGANWTNCMRLSGGNVVLGQYDSFKLIYYLNLGLWLQSGAFIDNN
jgi:hypothetical protein